MDGNHLMGNKKQKHDRGEGGLQLSDLPEAILHEIISYLSIKEAVRTSVLSKQWLDQWMHTSKLELDEKEFLRREQFIYIVGKLLVLFSDPKKLLKGLSLVFDVQQDSVKVSDWLQGFIKPELEELNLKFDHLSEPLVFPDDLFISKSLKSFELSMPQVFNTPSSIQLQSLRIMTLKYVIFPTGPLTQKFFASCPSLEELTLIDCIWKNVTHVYIVFPKLQKLVIREWSECDESEFVWDGNYCRIAIVGSNVKTFEYDGDLLNDYSLYSMVSVIDASLEVCPSNTGLDPRFFTFKLITALSDARRLTISDYAIEVLNKVPLLYSFLREFQNLVELRLSSSEPLDLCSRALQDILWRSPYLHALKFIMGVSLSMNAAEKFAPTPNCFGSNLKSIQISGFRGSEEEVHAIKFLLQCTPVLDEFIIYPRVVSWDSFEIFSVLETALEQVLEFPKASPNCVVEFV